VTVCGFKVVGRSARAYRSLHRGYAVAMELAPSERDEDFEPILLIGDGYSRDDAGRIVERLNQYEVHFDKADDATLRHFGIVRKKNGDA
jgi:hypothetical protein